MHLITQGQVRTEGGPGLAAAVDLSPPWTLWPEREPSTLHSPLHQQGGHGALCHIPTNPSHPEFCKGLGRHCVISEVNWPGSLDSPNQGIYSQPGQGQGQARRWLCPAKRALAPGHFLRLCSRSPCWAWPFPHPGILSGPPRLCSPTGLALPLSLGQAIMASCPRWLSGWGLPTSDEFSATGFCHLTGILEGIPLRSPSGSHCP